MNMSPPATSTGSPRPGRSLPLRAADGGISWLRSEDGRRATGRSSENVPRESGPSTAPVSDPVFAALATSSRL
ncbi:hypothetical protein [Streptomyces cacaoi]|uniref:hypothetical protein n=1 Tax=Streptomyces cacaoi TaxID=1898 RepID=UPI00261EB724|nr:hypothetical protein [Streptomyces cacaoi]